jgi:glc operon protein GlcG
MFFMRRFLFAALLATPALPVFADAQPLVRPAPALTEAGVQAALQEAERLAREAKDPAAIAIVDADGLLLGFIRMDGTRPGSVDLAIGNARTAALMQRPTDEIEDNVAKGRTALATAGLTALRGGAPLKAGGVTVGGIGVASLRKEDDSGTATAVAGRDFAAP